MRKVKRGFFLRYATKAPLRVERRRVKRGVQSEWRQLYNLHCVDVVVCIAGNDVAQRYEIRNVAIGIHHALTGARVEAEAIHLIINLHGHEDEIVLHVNADGVAKVLCR